MWERLGVLRDSVDVLNAELSVGVLSGDVSQVEMAATQLEEVAREIQHITNKIAMEEFNNGKTAES